MILQIGNVILTSEILTEYFCCDLDRCKGGCCVEGDSGAPLTLDEVGELEHVLDDVWPKLSAGAQAVIDRQGVAYTDSEGDLVTSIVDGKDCVFTCYDKDGCCLCATDMACREGRTRWSKPISCALYPVREKRLAGHLVGLQYHRWDICRPAVEHGRTLGIKIYRFLREPLVRRFGQDWYEELCEVAQELERSDK